MIYLCRPCAAYVGVHHGNTKDSKGRLANKELRELKKEAHSYFDRIRQENRMKREEEYHWLAAQLGLHRSQTHIGYFDDATTLEVIQVAQLYW